MRERLTVRASYDDGSTWAVARVVHDGPAAYSILTVLPDGSVGLLFERGDKSPYEKLTFASFRWRGSPMENRPARHVDRCGTQLP